MDYTITVQSSGLYTLDLRTASPRDTGQLAIIVNGDEKGSVDIASTGGWQEWETQVSAPFYLEEGEQTLRIFVETGGFNLDWLQLNKTSN